MPATRTSCLARPPIFSPFSCRLWLYGRDASCHLRAVFAGEENTNSTTIGRVVNSSQGKVHRTCRPRVPHHLPIRQLPELLRSRAVTTRKGEGVAVRETELQLVVVGSKPQVGLRVWSLVPFGRDEAAIVSRCVDMPRVITTTPTGRQRLSLWRLQQKRVTGKGHTGHGEYSSSFCDGPTYSYG